MEYEDINNNSPEGGIIVSFVFGGIAFIVIVSIWLLFRHKLAKIYYPRELHRSYQQRCCSWCLPTILRHGVQVAQRSGINGILLLKWRESAIVFICIISLFAMAVMLPVYLLNADPSLTCYTDEQGVTECPPLDWFTRTTAAALNPNSTYNFLVFAFTLIISSLFLTMVFYHRTEFVRIDKVTRLLGARYLQVATLERLPGKIKSDEEVQDKIQEVTGRQVRFVSICWLAPKLMHMQKEKLKSEKQLANHRELSKQKGEPSMFRPWKGYIPGSLLCRSKVDGVRYFEDKLTKLRAKITTTRNEALKKRRHNGFAFVVFENAEDCAYVLHNWKHLVHEKRSNTDDKMHPSRWKLGQARPVEEINWSNINSIRPQRVLNQIFSTLLILAIALFWSVPIAFLSSLDNMENLPIVGQPIANIAQQVPVLTSLFETLAPALLTLALVSFFPNICLYFARKEKHYIESDLYASAMIKYYIFIIFNSFVFYLMFSNGIDLANSLLQENGAISHAFQSIDWSTYGAFYCTYFISLALLDCALGYLRYSTVFLRYVEYFFKRHDSYIIKDDIFRPSKFRFFVAFAKESLYFAIILTFSPMVPLVSLFALLAYIMIYLSDKSNMLLCYRTDPALGDKMMRRFGIFINISMVLSFLFWIYFFASNGHRLSYLSALLYFFIWIAYMVISLGCCDNLRSSVRNPVLPEFSSEDSTSMMPIPTNTDVYSWMVITHPDYSGEINDEDDL